MTLPQRLQTGEYVGGTNLICLKNRVCTVLWVGKGKESGRGGRGNMIEIYCTHNSRRSGKNEKKKN